NRAAIAFVCHRPYRVRVAPALFVWRGYSCLRPLKLLADSVLGWSTAFPKHPALQTAKKTGACVQHRGRAALQTRQPFLISDGFKPLWQRFVAKARFSAAGDAVLTKSGLNSEALLHPKCFRLS